MSTPQISRCRKLVLHTIMSQPMLGMGAARIELLPAPKHISTAAVDAHGRVYINDEFFSKLSDNEARFVIAHEVLHLMLYHYNRIKDRDPARWNRAADRWINAFLVDHCSKDGMLKAPSSALLPLDPAHKEWTIEQIYDVEPVEPPKGSLDWNGNPLPTAGCGPDGNPNPQEENGDGGGSGGDGGSAESRDAAQETEQQLAASWRRLAQSAAAMARGAGLSAGDALAKLLTPPPAKVKWRTLVKRACEDAEAQAGDDDVSWQRRNRRRQDVYIPGHITTMHSVVVLLDSSGSVPDSSLAQAVAEIRQIAEEAMTPIYLIVHDAIVQWEGWVDDSIPKISAAVKGRGGTVFEPAYAAAAKVKRKFGVLVHLTDAMPYGPWPSQPRNVSRGVCALIGYSDANAVPNWMRTVPVEI